MCIYGLSPSRITSQGLPDSFISQTGLAPFPQTQLTISLLQSSLLVSLSSVIGTLPTHMVNYPDSSHPLTP